MAWWLSKRLAQELESTRRLYHCQRSRRQTDQLALINYQNQLQRESNKVAMRQYNNKMYKATLRFIVSKWVPYSAAMRLLTDWNNMQSQKNYTTIEMASRIECKAELLNLIADAPKKNILNIPAWAPERLLEPNKEMLLPLGHITEAAMVSKLVTCMSNQETAKRILLDHDGWEDAKEMAIRDDDAAFVLKKMQMRSRAQINSLSLDDNDRRKICRFHHRKGGCKFGDKCHFLHIDKEEKPKEKKTNNNKGPTKQTKHWIMNNREELIFPYIPYLLTYPSGSSPALSRRRKNTGVNLK